ncbi:MAG: ATP-binding protein [Kiritimatiellae bacterium]|nr:ATP-binding protein [Kiritimatiellia bacterium]
MEYLPRVCDAVLADALMTSGAVLIEGPKWCGKTSLGKRQAKSVLMLHDPDRSASYLALAETMPSRLLIGETPRLIDEWQDAPQLWNAVRFMVDERGGTGHFILTGSSTPRDELQSEAKRHSGAGRISRLKMLPMSLFESLESSGEVSLAALFNGVDDIAGESKVKDIEQLAYVICRGGWPEAVTTGGARALRRAENYLDTIAEEDIHHVDGVEKNPMRVRTLLRSLARNVSTLATNKTIMDDVKANDYTISDKTLSAYMNALQRLFVVMDEEAWLPSLRSKAAIRSSAKRQFSDPSIAAAALKASPEKLLGDFETFGFLFESLAVRDVRAYATPIGGEVLHYHDETGLESDMIVQLKDGRWGAIEVKLGGKLIDEAAEHLRTLCSKIDTSKVGNPSFLMVLTGTEFAYRRKDGVLVCPIGCLKP